jgi:hypothetical protein
MKDQKGFSAIEILLVVVGAGIIGFVGWHVWSKNHEAKEPVKQNSHAKKSQKPTITYRTYNDALLGYSIEYPETWSMKTSNGTQGEGGPQISDTTITSPRGTKLILSDNYGGKGGGPCQDPYTETPFEPNNICSSQEFISVQPLKSTTYDQDGNKVPFLLTHYVYAYGREVNVVKNYAICLEADDNKQYPIKVDGAHLEVQYPRSVVLYDAGGEIMKSKPFYISACATSTSPDFFTNEDGRTVDKILETFKFN